MASAASLSLVILAWLLWRTAAIGLPHVDGHFLTSFPSGSAARAGIRSAFVGTLWLGILTLVIALPLGVGAGIYLNEYARPTRTTRVMRSAVANLAGVPSVVFGILGLVLFVRIMGLGHILLAGALTLSLMSLPVIIVATEEALKAVPRTVREAAYSVGATRWQVTRSHVLPYSIPGILTGSILALARAMGETAPLILVGGATAVFFTPESPFDLYSALPLQAFNWAQDARPAFQSLAAAATVVLLSLVLVLNLAAILLRNHFQRKVRW